MHETGELDRGEEFAELGACPDDSVVVRVQVEDRGQGNGRAV